jgi:hypothetical protein
MMPNWPSHPQKGTRKKGAAEIDSFSRTGQGVLLQSQKANRRWRSTFLEPDDSPAENWVRFAKAVSAILLSLTEGASPPRPRATLRMTCVTCDSFLAFDCSQTGAI